MPNPQTVRPEDQSFSGPSLPVWYVWSYQAFKTPADTALEAIVPTFHAKLFFLQTSYYVALMEQDFFNYIYEVAK